MNQRYHPERIVDAHQHLWVISERPYEWLLPEYEILYRDYRQSDVQQDLEKHGIGATVLVQASDSYADTFFLLSVAQEANQISGIVGWVPMDRPEEALAALKIFGREPVFKGLRALTHLYRNPDWIAGPEVSKTLGAMAIQGLSLDYVAISPPHREAILAVAKRHPELSIVLDHFTKPDISAGEWEPWASAMRELAECPNVYSKISGLNTLSRLNWVSSDWDPYVRFMVEAFGSQRLMIGSDWPFARQNGEFSEVWEGLLEVISNYPPNQQDDIFYKTAEKFYRLR
jgi:L-fuconolactonase